MRVIIEKNYDELARWAARHVVETIKAFHPTAEKPFVLVCQQVHHLLVCMQKS